MEVRQLVHDASRRIEIALGAVRLAFLVIILARYFYQDVWVEEKFVGDQRAAMDVPVLVLGIVASSLLLVRVYRARATPLLLVVSTSLDALLCMLSLLSGVVHPWETYRGLLRSPDTAVLPLLSAAAGLRFSRLALVAGAALNGLGFVGLVLLDCLLNPSIADYGPGDVFLYGCYMAVATVMGVILASRGRSLAHTAARSATRAEAARAGLLRVLAASHDLRSVASAANIRAALATREASRGARVETHVLEALRYDLDALAQLLAGSRDEAYAELMRTEALTLANVSESVRSAGERVQLRFPQLVVKSEGDGSVGVLMAGGRLGLERILVNLFANSAEGDGRRGAAVVTASWTREEGRLRLTVYDDGPGFEPTMVDGVVEPRGTKKPGGSGLGLVTCCRIVEASYGTLELANTAGGGARVSMVLLLG